MRPPIRTALALALAVALPACGFAQTEDDPETRARALMAGTPLIDGHNDLPWQVREKTDGDLAAIDIATDQPEIHTDISRLRDGLVGAQFFVAYVPSDYIGAGATRFGLMQVDLIHRMVDRYPDTFALATTADEIEGAFNDGKIAALIGLEGAHAIEGSLDVLRAFYDLGVRYATLTHWRSHAWADAATDEPRHGGLSPFGELVIQEMNRLGMLIDLSHVSDSTMTDVLTISEAPVIFSHSSARAIADHVRNVPDDILRMTTENGGIVMVNYAPAYINDEIGQWESRASAARDSLREALGEDEAGIDAGLDAWRAENPPPSATLAQVADHIDHLVSVAGIDHVGFGSDYDGIDTTPTGLEDVSTFPIIVAELLRRGYTDDDMRKLIGENFLRVMREAEAVAARLSAERDPIIGTIDPSIEESEPQ